MQVFNENGCLPAVSDATSADGVPIVNRHRGYKKGYLKRTASLLESIESEMASIERERQRKNKGKCEKTPHTFSFLLTEDLSTKDYFFRIGGMVFRFLANKETTAGPQEDGGTKFCPHCIHTANIPAQFERHLPKIMWESA